MSEQTDDIDQKIADMIAVLEEFEERFELIRGNFNALNKKVKRLQSLILPDISDIQDNRDTVAHVAHVAPPEGEVTEIQPMN